MNIEQEKMIVESLPSLYPLQKHEEDAINVVLDALPHWIPVTENTPKEYHRVCLVTMNGCLEPYTDKSTWVDGKWYQIEYTTDGYPRKIDITDAVLAWMPLPEPYQKGEQDDR